MPLSIILICLAVGGLALLGWLNIHVARARARLGEAERRRLDDEYRHLDGDW